MSFFRTCDGSFPLSMLSLKMLLGVLLAPLLAPLRYLARVSLVGRDDEDGARLRALVISIHCKTQPRFVRKVQPYLRIPEAQHSGLKSVR